MKKILFTIIILTLTVTLGVQVTNAIGTLTPVGNVGEATQYTLNDIYERLTTNNSTSTNSGTFTTPGSVIATFRTLTEIYNAIPTIDANKVATGTTYLGVTGNLQGLPPIPTWQTDPELNLCWGNGQFEINNGCSIGNGWTAEGYGAAQYCENLVTEGFSDWRLPTILEYSSITDYSTFNNATQVPGFTQVNSDYWSGTLYSGDSNSAWIWNNYYGSKNFLSKSDQYSVRCVR